MTQLTYSIKGKKEGEVEKFVICAGRKKWQLKWDREFMKKLIKFLDDQNGQEDGLLKSAMILSDLKLSCKGMKELTVGIVKGGSLKEDKVKQGMKMAEIPDDCKTKGLEENCELVVSIGWDECLVFGPMKDPSGYVQDRIVEQDKEIALMKQEIDCLKDMIQARSRINLLQQIDELKARDENQSELIQGLIQQIQQLKVEFISGLMLVSPVFTDSEMPKQDSNKTVKCQSEKWVTALTELVFPNHTSTVFAFGLKAKVTPWLFIGGCSGHVKTVSDTNLADVCHYLGEHKNTQTIGCNFNTGDVLFQGSLTQAPSDYVKIKPSKVIIAVDMRKEGCMKVFYQTEQDQQIKLFRTLSQLNKRFPDHGFKFCLQLGTKNDCVTIMPTLPKQDIEFLEQHFMIRSIPQKES